jgi:hypothetical protein
MTKVRQATKADPLDRQIDFRDARPHPYWLGVVDRNCVRLLERDLANAFPDDAAVNEALRTLVRASNAAATQEISAKTATDPKLKKKASS